MCLSTYFAYDLHIKCSSVVIVVLRPLNDSTDFGGNRKSRLACENQAAISGLSETPILWNVLIISFILFSKH